MSIFNDMKELLSEHGFDSTAEFARALGKDASNVAKTMNGAHIPSTSVLIQYANVLKVPVDSVLRIYYKAEFKENDRIVADQHRYI